MVHTGAPLPQWHALLCLPCHLQLSRGCTTQACCMPLRLRLQPRPCKGPHGLMRPYAHSCCGMQDTNARADQRVLWRAALLRQPERVPGSHSFWGPGAGQPAGRPSVPAACALDRKYLFWAVLLQVGGTAPAMCFALAFVPCNPLVFNFWQQHLRCRIAACAPWLPVSVAKSAWRQSVPVHGF